MGGFQAAFLLCCGLLCASEQNPRVRLTGGPNPCSGFLQILHAGQWGNVCDDGWTEQNAAVVCRELRCGGVLNAKPNTESFTRPEGEFLLDEVNCTGEEESVMLCGSDGLGKHKCVMLEEVAVTCSETIRLRLSDGQSRCAGRVEVYSDGSWGGVCGDIWNEKNAEVVCRELNCGNHERTPEKLHFGKRIDPVRMSSLRCSTKESHLWQCAQSSTPQCSSNNGAQVICSGHREVRLKGAERACGGQLLVKKQADLMDVCPDHWSPQAAQMACKQLGCGTPLPSPTVASGSHDWKTLKPNGKHLGNETTLWPDLLPEGVNCSSPAAVHLDCSGNVTVRLSDDCAGVVEVFHEGARRKVCHRGAGDWSRNAKVVCQETGCGEFGFFGQADHGRSSSQLFAMSDVDCLGSEGFLWQCGFSRNFDDCTGKEVHMACSKGLALRLADGSSRCAGRVEVQYLGKWGTVCQNGWVEESSRTVCKELGCGDAGRSAESVSIFGEGVDTIWFTKVACKNYERFLWECDHSFQTQGCTHSMDKGVVCQRHVDLQLKGGSCSGQLEVMTFNGQWRPVRNTTDWDDNTADVACRQLHCGDSVGAYFEEGKVDPRISFHCRGNESSLTDCEISEEPEESSDPTPYPIDETRSSSEYLDATSNPIDETSTGSGDSEDDDGVYGDEEDPPPVIVGPPISVIPEIVAPPVTVLAVKCSENPVLRLAGGGHRCAGRVEIYYQGQWGTVCDTNWDEQAAKLVCRELKCGSVLDHRFKGVGDANAPQAWLDLQQCKVDTQFLWHCSSKQRKLHTCRKGSPAEVICSGSVEYRLVNGRSPCAGMVEVLFQHRWRKVCRSPWWQVNGGFVCAKLKCGSMVNMYPGEKAGSDVNEWVNEVKCKDGAYNAGCEVEAITKAYCSTKMAAAMTCSGHRELYLKGNGNPCSGQVQVHYMRKDNDKYHYQAISEIGWDQKDADVACQQLNCGKANNISSTTFEVADRLSETYHCSGNESSLWGCNTTSVKREATRAATVTCSETIEVRLNGSHRCSGRVELKYQEKWGTVCSQHWDNDNGFGIRMCKALGCKTFIAAINMKASDADIIWANYLHCGANSLHPWQCLTTPPQDRTCPSGQAIAIVCSASLAFRLKGGYSKCDGRVEVRYNGEWGTVCNRKLDNMAANLICKSLNCGKASLLSHSSITEHGGLPAVLTDLNCANGNEKLEHCPGKWGKRDCPHPRPASLVCSEGIDPETMKIDVATVVSSVLVPFLLALLVALGFVSWRCWQSSKKRSFFRKPSEKIYDEIPGDTRDSDAKDADAMMRMEEMGGIKNPLNQLDSQKNTEGAADSDIEDERYDDAEVVIPLSWLPGQPDASRDGLHPEPETATVIEKPAPNQRHSEFEVIQLDP
ncbi:scavenger receptor cysteine-rich type 1 protein M130-like [Lissotriton helveticus]